MGTTNIKIIVFILEWIKFTGYIDEWMDRWMLGYIYQ